MKITRINYETERINEPIVACMGYFDGLHQGHQALMNQAIVKSKLLNVASAMITFDPDPWIITKHIDPQSVKHIHDLATKTACLEAFNIEHLVIVEFTKAIANLSHEAFIAFLESKLIIKGLVVGFDFHYGFQGLGTHLTLVEDAKGNFEVDCIEAVNDHFGKISTSRIDEALSNGQISVVNQLLGYTYFLQGTVVHGQKQGRKIGFPTANIDYSQELLLPKVGVYAGYVLIDNQHYYGMINVGHNPTFNQSLKTSVEVYIADFNQIIYGKVIQVYFNEYLRAEIKFNSIDELIEQMQKDLEKTMQQSPFKALHD